MTDNTSLVSVFGARASVLAEALSQLSLDLVALVAKYLWCVSVSQGKQSALLSSLELLPAIIRAYPHFSSADGGPSIQGLTLSSQGHLWVSCFGVVCAFDHDGKLHRLHREVTRRPGKITFVANDGNGELYLVDNSMGIAKMNLGIDKRWNDAIGGFFDDVAADSERIFALNSNGVVDIFTHKFLLASIYPREGKRWFAIAIDSERRELFMFNSSSDIIRAEILVYDYEGKLKRVINCQSITLAFGYASSMCSDGQGHVFIASKSLPEMSVVSGSIPLPEICVFDIGVGQTGKSSKAITAFSVPSPAVAITIDRDHRIWAGLHNGNVNVYGFAG